MTLQAATAQALLNAWRDDNDDYELVAETTEPDDHGYGYTMVFKRLEDETFWETYGVSQNQGDYHTLRDGDAGAPQRVYPHSVTTIEYRPVPPA